jgi:hypothetical protein
MSRSLHRLGEPPVLGTIPDLPDSIALRTTPPGPSARGRMADTHDALDKILRYEAGTSAIAVPSADLSACRDTGRENWFSSGERSFKRIEQGTSCSRLVSVERRQQCLCFQWLKNLKSGEAQRLAWRISESTGSTLPPRWKNRSRQNWFPLL